MYVPLRAHSHHSLLTGVGSPRDWVRRAEGFGLPALALCEVDSLGGTVEFLQAAQGSGVRAIIGAELSAPDPESTPGRLICLVRDQTGYQNLCKLVSARQIGHDPGSQKRPKEGEGGFDLVHAAVRWQAGLFFLVDHPHLLLQLYGRVPAGQIFAALPPRTSKAPQSQVAAGADSTSIKTPDPARPFARSELIDAARATGAALLAVPDIYYPKNQDRELHRLHVAIKRGALLEALPDAWLCAQPGHIPNAKQMNAAYADVPDVPGEWPMEGEQPAPVARTLAVAEACQYTPPLGGVLFPRVELEEHETPYSKLCQMAFDGARKRYRPMPPEVLGRLDYELSTIENLGFAPYFLLVERIAAFAKAENIPHVGRGSAADSLVAYCLKLTDADPLRYKLPFERFLNPGRKDRPDVDLDFCWRRRDDVLQHVFDLFGHERTAMISTLNRFGARSAFREAALAQGIPPAEFQRWSHRIPMFGGMGGGASAELFSGTAEAVEVEETEGADAGASKKISQEQRHSGGWSESTHPGEGGGGGGSADPKPSHSLAEALRTQPETKDFPFHDPRFAAALADASKLLETPRHFGLHPGGVVVSPTLITDHLSCAPSAKGPTVTQLDKDGVEALGLVKMDLLGNRALTTLQDTLDSLAKQGIHIDLESLPEDDAKTADLLRQGRSLACFQIESPGMRHLLQQTGACTMDDVIQAVALIRPGPAQAGMKDAYVRRFRKLEKPDPPHPSLRETLAETYGIMLYQEDVMHVAAKAAGMDLPTADKLRRALQKRRLSELPELHSQFTRGCLKNGWSQVEAQDVWQLIEGFASFAFCKAHAVTYGRISYRAAWLKAHYPVEYITAFLNSQTGYYAPRVYVEEARRLGATILGPDINRSLVEFHVDRVMPNRVIPNQVHFHTLRPTQTTANSRPEPTEVCEDLPGSVSHGSASHGRLRMGLGSVHGLSNQTLRNILEAREQQPFLSLPDFLERTGAHSDEAKNLIRSGALDSFDHTRPELLWRLHLLRSTTTRPPTGTNLNLAQWNACRSGTDPIFESPSAGWSGQGLGLQATRLAPGEQVSLFGEPPASSPVMPGLPDWDALKRGLNEHELLGVTLNAHPTQLFACPGEVRMRAATSSSPADRRAPMPPLPCADLPTRTGARVTLRAWLAASRRVHTKNGQYMRFLTLEDPSGIAEAVLFPNIYKQTTDRIRSDETLLISGTIEDQMGAHLLRVEYVW